MAKKPPRSFLANSLDRGGSANERQERILQPHLHNKSAFLQEEHTMTPHRYSSYTQDTPQRVPVDDQLSDWVLARLKNK